MNVGALIALFIGLAVGWVSREIVSDRCWPPDDTSDAEHRRVLDSDEAIGQRHDEWFHSF